VITLRCCRKAKQVLLALAACATALSCAQGKRPFLIVQLCLKDRDGVALFKSEMQALAQRERLRYVDGSYATQRDLKVIGATGRNMHANGGLIYIGVEGEDGFGLEAGNLGLNDFDVAVGFGDTEPVDASRKFADRVVAQLKTHWPVSVVPPGRGALPDPNCQADAKSTHSGT
jgi:hypothetical protein